MTTEAEKTQADPQTAFMRDLVSLGEKYEVCRPLGWYTVAHLIGTLYASGTETGAEGLYELERRARQESAARLREDMIREHL